jgi:hypothetical protein
MDKDLEDELLMHIAAGTALPTALAALPTDDGTYDDAAVESRSTILTKLGRAITWIAFAVAGSIGLWAIVRR